MEDNTQVIPCCVTVVVMFGILVLGPVECSVRSQQQATKRVEVVCAGDLKTDAARAAACVQAVTDARNIGKD